jgi:hypothetical protein
MQSSFSRGVRKITRLKFTPEEDIRLRELVSIRGPHAWSEVSREMGTRTIRQCRDRWNRYLSVAPGNAPWTAEDDTLLLQMVERVGMRWQTVARSFPGRSDVDVKQRWSSLFRVNGPRTHYAPPPNDAPMPKEPATTTQTSETLRDVVKDEQSLEDLHWLDHESFLDE